MKVLLIGDDQKVMKHISFSLHLRWPNTTVVSAAVGSRGIELTKAESPDVVMVDFSLPDMSCADLVTRIREFSYVPLIVLMGEESEMDRAELLEAGADEYFVKPFSPTDVQARVNALLRRTRGEGFKPGHLPFVAGNLEINFATRQVFVSGVPVELSPLEYDLLCELVTNEGRVLTHRALLEKVWGPEYVSDLPLVKDLMYRLRKKLGCGENHRQLIRSERGVGYKFMELS